MDSKTCACCKRRFSPHPAVRNQRYCGRTECQRSRKTTWQRDKLARDRDYRDNQADAQRQWRCRNRHYWTQYRQRNPAYAETNRRAQRQRNRRRNTHPAIAKMDGQRAESLITSGRYRLVPLCDGMIAKMDELIVEIGLVSRGYPALSPSGP
jgi:hypothetical protein